MNWFRCSCIYDVRVSGTLTIRCWDCGRLHKVRLRDLLADDGFYECSDCAAIVFGLDHTVTVRTSTCHASYREGRSFPRMRKVAVPFGGAR